MSARVGKGVLRRSGHGGMLNADKGGQNVADVFYGWPLIFISFLANFIFTILIGWQAYRGDQIHRKNSPT